MGTPWISFDGKDCSGCKHLNDRGYCEFTACIIPCTVRATIPAVKPKTNADRIRSMSDEEFSHFLFGIQCAPASKPKEWLDWLKQEAET